MQACKVPKNFAHNAFRILLIHRNLQFTVLIALCCVLHRFTSRGIHRLGSDFRFNNMNWLSCTLYLKVAENQFTNEYHHWCTYIIKVLLVVKPFILANAAQLFQGGWIEIRAHSVSRSSTSATGVNDPSAGSPTEALLRLVLPLSDKVY